MNKEITIRNGLPNDLKELQRLFVDTITFVCKGDYNAEQIKIWTSSIEDKIRWNDIIEKQLVLVAQDENKIVGFTTLSNYNYIDLFYIHKDYQRLGIANKLYSKVEHIAKQNEQTELTSDVSITARPFFNKVGFEVVKQQTVVRKNVDFTNFKMKKLLH